MGDASRWVLVYSRPMHPEGNAPGGGAKGLPQIGQTLGGKYEIVRLLGEGGMAFVYEANHRRLQQRVAIKLLTPEFARDPELVARFEREARGVARLRTKHVARVMDVDTTPEGVPYIVMEFLEGRDLDAELTARTRLPLAEAVDIVLQTCGGLVEAHGMGIVHRDLKPANLFLANELEGNDRVVKVLDFGISKFIGEATRLTSSGAVMGTVLYMSPEQVRARPGVDTRADIWALGVILYELLAGRAPWEGHSHQIAAAIVSTDPPDLRSLAQVPDAVVAAVRTMMQREPSQRFSTVQEVIAALGPFAPPGSIGASIVEHVAVGQTGSRSRAVLGSPSAKHTIPMGSRPSALDAAAASARTAAMASTAASSSPSASLSSPPPASHPTLPPPESARQTPPHGKLALIVAVVVGLLGSTGVALILVTILRRPPPAPAALDASRGSTSASAAEPPPATAVASTEEPKPAAPPATGTTGGGAPAETSATRPTLPRRGADGGQRSGPHPPGTHPLNL